jgi:cation transport regulator ChaC
MMKVRARSNATIRAFARVLWLFSSVLRGIEVAPGEPTFDHFSNAS